MSSLVWPACGKRIFCGLVIVISRPATAITSPGSAAFFKPRGLGESLRRALTSLAGFLFPVPRRRLDLDRIDKAAGSVGHFFNSPVERLFVGLGRMGCAAELADELDGRRANLIIGRRRREIGEGFDISAHD